MSRWGYSAVTIAINEDRSVRKVVGWGSNIQVGDTLLLRDDVAPYVLNFRVEEVEYHSDPPDMFRAILSLIQ